MPVRPTSGIGRWVREPYCGLSHAIGAVASLVGMILLLCFTTGGAMSYVAVSIYGTAAVLLFTASALTHSWHGEECTIDAIERYDYAAIFLLIAGTYTPICLTVLRGPWGYTLLAIEAAFAVVGVTLVFTPRVPRRLISILYLPMAWLIVVALVPVMRLMPRSAFLCLVIGGVFFTLGAVVFLTHKPKLWPGRFGYHDLWHTMVLAGAGCHFATVAVVAL